VTAEFLEHSAAAPREAENPPCVVIVDDERFALEVLRDVLESAGYLVDTAQNVDDAMTVIGDLGEAVDCVLLDIRLSPAPVDDERRSDGVDMLRWLKEQSPDLGVIMVSAYATVDNAVLSLNLGADAYIQKPVEPEELLAVVAKTVERRRLSLAKARLEAQAWEQNRFLIEKNRELAEANRRLNAAYSVIQSDLQLAQRLQLSLLPQQFPQVPGFRFATLYIPSGALAGDFYDVFRLDENHLAFYVADAVGHGVRAALITTLLKKSITFKTISDNSYRLLGPAEAIQRLNEDMVREGLSEVPFLTMVCFVLNFHTRELRYAAGGHPHPLLLRADGSHERLESEGGLVGVFEQEYEERRCILQPGDRLLCYTDGIEQPLGAVAPACITSFQAIVEKHRSRTLADMLEACQQELLSLIPGPGLDDDLVLLGLEVYP